MDVDAPHAPESVPPPRPSGHWWRSCLLLLLALGISIWLVGIMARRRVEQHAIHKLRAIGLAELAYQDANNNKDYATLRNLERHGDFPGTRSRGSVIGNYSLAVFDVWNWSENCCPGCDCIDSMYTIIALPHPRRWGLRTFAMCDDIRVRVAPTNRVVHVVANKDHRPSTGDCPCKWEAVR